MRLQKGRYPRAKLQLYYNRNVKATLSGSQILIRIFAAVMAGATPSFFPERDV